jgi:hypothetical protein
MTRTGATAMAETRREFLRKAAGLGLGLSVAIPAVVKEATKEPPAETVAVHAGKLWRVECTFNGAADGKVFCYVIGE